MGKDILGEDFLNLFSIPGKGLCTCLRVTDVHERRPNSEGHLTGGWGLGRNIGQRTRKKSYSLRNEEVFDENKPTSSRSVP